MDNLSSPARLTSFYYFKDSKNVHEQWLKDNMKNYILTNTFPEEPNLVEDLFNDLKTTKTAADQLVY